MLKKVSKVVLVTTLIMLTCLTVNPINANTEYIPTTTKIETKVVIPKEKPSNLVASLEQPRLTRDIRVTNKELNCLALNIYFESRGEPILGQKAVAWVTLNRLKSKKYAKTICGVVYQKGQFSWTFDGLSDRPKSKKQWDASLRIARLVVQEFERGKLDPTHGATMFHAKHVHPQWKKKYKMVLRIGNHIFYR